MKADIVHQYYKDLETGVEMSFSKYPDWGWVVGFHNIDFEGSLDYIGKIPWPELSAEEQDVVNLNYERLYRNMT